MVTRTPKKSRKMRGNRHSGWGAGKKHRGAGHRGGRGHAGVGKRGASKKPRYLAQGKNPIGKSGMRIIRNRTKDKTINLSTIYEKLDSWVKQGKVKKEKNAYIVNLTELGYDKLLGTGKIAEKLNITVSKISKSAKEKLGIKD